jgi:peptidoglycan hydrolase-like protein with peptidoglycan-binding domain
MRRFLIAAIGAAVVVAPAGIATTEAAAAPPPHHATQTSWPVIRQGARGERVRVIQSLLNQRGLRVAVDGAFGIATTNAVKTFQRSHHLTIDGHVGPNTWTRLIITLRNGSRGSAVRGLQHQLRFQYGYRGVIVDGTFGRDTTAAVKSFQARRHLTADGVVGVLTWKALQSR